jgi:hypothetical protein
MKVDQPHPGSFYEAQILMLPNIIHLEGMPKGIAMPPKVLPFLHEHQSMVVVLRPVRELQLRLRRFVFAQEDSCFRRDRDGPTLTVLERAKDRGRTGLDELSHDRFLPSLQVDILPLQPA